MKPTKDYILVSVQFVLFALYVIQNEEHFQVGSILKIIALLLALLGFVICILSLIQLNKNLSPYPSPKSGSELVTNGIYGIVRHPIYTGIIVTTVSFGVYNGDIIRIVIGVVIWILFEYKASYEEGLLSDKFPEYEGYKKATGKIFPGIG